LIRVIDEAALISF